MIDSLQLTAKHSVATPVNWDHGQDVVIVPTISDEQAKDKVRLHHSGVDCSQLQVDVAWQLTSAHGPCYHMATDIGHAADSCRYIACIMTHQSGVLAQFPKGWKTAELPSGKGYLRLTPEPPQTA